jgi:hypothetical protein
MIGAVSHYHDSKKQFYKDYIKEPAKATVVTKPVFCPTTGKQIFATEAI